LLRIEADPTISKIPRVAISASIMKGERQRCLTGGFVGFIEKPFDIYQFRQAIAHYVDGAPPKKAFVLSPLCRD
jgi:CheY-like chemotaxis protein